MTVTAPLPRIIPVAEDAVLLEFSQQIEPQLAPVISAWAVAIRQQLGQLLTDLVPSYGSITVYYDLTSADFRLIISLLKTIPEKLSRQPAQRPGRLVELPVWYHPSVGPDL
ncbi:carboxyltransferase domain-containing protein, partial [Marinobacter segnicrescens]|uniref:carboxyltransferase domain-containing protein n=2 Tax=Marinobacter TaxID=2742 RepID=UPI003A9287C9